MSFNKESIEFVRFSCCVLGDFKIWSSICIQFYYNYNNDQLARKKTHQFHFDQLLEINLLLNKLLNSSNVIINFLSSI